MRMNRVVLCVAAILTLASASAIAQPSLRQKLQLESRFNKLDQSFIGMTGEEESSKKSVLLGIAYSLLVPGLGDFYAKKGETGKYYLGADVALWLTYGGFQSYGHWVKNDARTYAVEKASANFTGKNQQFEVDLGNFISTDEYNQAKLRNRQYELLYDVSSAYAWKWNSDEDRLRFKNERIRGDEIIRNSQFVIGALVINRIVAAISAARSVSEFNRNVQSTSWRVHFEATGGILTADAVVLTFSKNF
jgi:hypothetical protein